MLQVFALLAEEHRQLNQLLELLEQRVAQYFDGVSAAPPAWLMRDALEYMQQYPELFHHPLEDRLMRQVEPKVKDPRLLAEMARIHSEHQLLEQQTAALVLQFEAICHDQVVAIRPLFEAFSDYAQLLRDHLKREELRLFPAFKALLSEADGAELMRRHKPIDDPLFINAPRSGFADLYRELIEPAAA